MGTFTMMSRQLLVLAGKSESNLLRPDSDRLVFKSSACSFSSNSSSSKSTETFQRSRSFAEIRSKWGHSSP